MKKVRVHVVKPKLKIPKSKRYIDRIKPKSFDTSGLSIKDIMNIDPDKLNRLTTGQFKDLTQRLVSAANKRLKYLENSEVGRISPAYLKFEKSNKEKFSTKNKTLNQLRNEFKLAKNFLERDTSTVKGFKKIKKKAESYFGADNLSNKSYKKLWEGYRKFEETNKGLILQIKGSRSDGSLQIMKLFYQKFSKKINQETLDDKINKLYEDLMDDGDEFDITDAFDLDF